MEEALQTPEELEEVVEVVETPTQEEIPEETLEEAPEEILEEEATFDPAQQLQAVADALVNYGGTGSVETVAQELVSMMEGLLEAHALELERSEKTGRLTFALSQIVHDPGAVLGLIELDAVDFDPSNLADLRDFLEPIYQQKPYLFKVISPLRGATVATGLFGKNLPTNAELGALSMEEYTAYRAARGSVSR